MYSLCIDPRLEPPAYLVPECPVCGGECGWYFLNINREIIGCDECREAGEEFDDCVDAWGWDNG